MNILSITFFTSFIFTAECSLNETYETITPTKSTTDTRYRNIQIFKKKCLRKNLIHTLNSVNITNGFNFNLTEEDYYDYLSYMYKNIYQRVDGHVVKYDFTHANIIKLIVDYLTVFNTEDAVSLVEETPNTVTKPSQNDGFNQQKETPLEDQPCDEPLHVIPTDKLEKKLKSKYPNLFKDDSSDKPQWEFNRYDYPSTVKLLSEEKKKELFEKYPNLFDENPQNGNLNPEIEARGA